MNIEKDVQITQNEIVSREEFSFYIKSLRLSRNLTRKELSRLIGCPENDITQYEKGERIPYDPFSYVESLKEVIKRKRK